MAAIVDALTPPLRLVSIGAPGVTNLIGDKRARPANALHHSSGHVIMPPYAVGR